MFRDVFRLQNDATTSHLWFDWSESTSFPLKPVLHFTSEEASFTHLLLSALTRPPSESNVLIFCSSWWAPAATFQRSPSADGSTGHLGLSFPATCCLLVLLLSFQPSVVLIVVLFQKNRDSTFGRTCRLRSFCLRLNLMMPDDSPGRRFFFLSWMNLPLRCSCHSDLFLLQLFTFYWITLYNHTKYIFSCPWFV